VLGGLFDFFTAFSVRDDENGERSKRRRAIEEGQKKAIAL
jgi:hypothetical protein